MCVPCILYSLLFSSRNTQYNDDNNNNNNDNNNNFYIVSNSTCFHASASFSESLSRVLCYSYNIIL